MVEHYVDNVGVVGSSPAKTTTPFIILFKFFYIRLKTTKNSYIHKIPKFQLKPPTTI